VAHEYEFIKHFEGTHLKTFLVNMNHRLYHWHSDLELLMVIEGSVFLNTALKQYELKKDDIFVINRISTQLLSNSQKT
jgi:mannose-6-phosphate isomerase-like protein (cupin superfamily)